MNGTIFFLGSIELEVRGADANTLRGLLASLGACQTAIVPPTTRVRIEIDGSGTIYADDHPVAYVRHAEDALPSIERQIYARALERVAPVVTLHGAAVTDDGDTPLLLVGCSGAGKSTLARAMVEHGYAYLTDELIFYDGSALWGAPRTIQFEPTPVDQPRPSLLCGCDMTSYRFRGATGERLALPLWPLPPTTLATKPCSAAQAVIVLLEGSARSTELLPCTPLEALVGLHRAGVGPLLPTSPDIAALVGNSRCFHLIWNNVRKASTLLASTTRTGLISPTKLER